MRPAKQKAIAEAWGDYRADLASVKTDALDYSVHEARAWDRLQRRLEVIKYARWRD